MLINKMRSIREIKNFEGKRVLLRADWDVLVEDGKIVDTTKVNNSFETMNYILDNGGKVLVLSHFGREGKSLKPVYEYVNGIMPAVFFEDLETIPDEKIVILENTRKFEGEKENSEEFTQKLASLGDIFVNDAFASSHENHASIVGIPKLLPSYAGLHFMQEYENLSRALDPLHPFLLILGGAKFDTKLPLVKKFLDIADDIFVLGAISKPASEMDIVNNPKIILPVGDVAALDGNSETVALIKEKSEKAKFILWNGPLGKYEEGYTEGTKKLAQILADICISKNIEVIVGGGDTLTAIKELGIKDKFTFVSSAGGAMLDFLATGTLPGIEVLNSL